MADLGDLIAHVPLGDEPATVPPGFVLPGGESTAAALRRAEADIERLRRERDWAVDELSLRRAQAQAGREELSAEIAAFKSMRLERDEARAEIVRLTAELDSARDSLGARTAALVRAREAVRHGDVLCPRCGEALAAEADAEKAKEIPS